MVGAPAARALFGRTKIPWESTTIAATATTVPARTAKLVNHLFFFIAFSITFSYISPSA
jgi:hypothetical protein